MTSKRFIAGFALSAAMAPSAPAFAAGSGGTEFTPLPVIKKVKCISHCSGDRRVQAGGAIKLVGKRLGEVETVVFLGSGKTAGDDVEATVLSARRRVVRVEVPLGAPSGRVSAWSSEVVGSEPSRRIEVLPPPPPERSVRLSPASGPREPGAPRLETGVSTTKAFFAGTKVRFSYRVNDTEPVPVHIELIHVEDGMVVRSWDRGPVEPNVVHTIRWSGKSAPGKSANAGRYVWRLSAQDSEGLTAESSNSSESVRDAFDFYGHKFPIRGRHDYGDSGARFGSGRGGRSHQGQDVFAKCGTKMVAARAGKVKFNQYHSAAGYYLVIDGYRSPYDYVYMHLQDRSPWKPGEKVRTGQKIGRVGDSGNASGCHLHYEMWGSPGWYDGGSPIDPFRPLKRWDSWS